MSTPVELSAQRAGDEIDVPADSFKKLDTFEALNLEDADKLYNREDYKGAFAAYRAYSFEFPKSKATPYVLLRMGRCLHKLEKRNAAIKQYEDVVNYFPDSVRYAAAAMYYIGRCHGQNGDPEKQTAVWARMVKDKDYVAQPNSGTALTHLGKAMEKIGKHEEATEYHWRTAVSFLKSNPGAARNARESVLYHYAVRSPNHEKLSEFYVAASGFDGRGRNSENAEEDTSYWEEVLRTALKQRDKELRENACAYWSGQLGTRFPENDEIRKLWCDAMLAHEKDPELWHDRMTKQFASKPSSMDRIVQWLHYYKRDSKLQRAFFDEKCRPALSSMENEKRIWLMKKLHHPLRMEEEAHIVVRSVDTRGMKDEQLLEFIDFADRYEPEEVILRHIKRIKDPLTATKARYDYYKGRSHRNRPNMEKALAEIPALQKSPKYANNELKWDEAELLRMLGRYEEAIKAYRAASRQPDSTWKIADCLVALKQYDKAIQKVRELESIGGETASKACLRIAEIYRQSGDKAREVDQLRLVLKRYPKSRAQSEAHNRLEKYGVALVGGESEAKD